MDDAERWLKENDPDFHYKKRRQFDYPYLTTWQKTSREKKEIPVSNLWAMRNKLIIKDAKALEIIETLK